MLLRTPSGHVVQTTILRGRRKLTLCRNIDRVLVGATPTEYGELSYKDHGLLLCEVHLLRQAAIGVLERRNFDDFLVDMEDLVDVRSGLERQKLVAERIWRAYFFPS
jgi:nuclear-control-of-ATPase protein 2